MRKHLLNYLSDAHRDANQAIMSANGERKFNADGFLDQAHNFTDPNDPANFFMRADGAAAQPVAAQESQPYIITVSNASATQINGFNIWGAATYIGGSNSIAGASWSAGSLTISGVTLTSAISNMTYFEMLQQSNTSPFTVGRTYLASVSGSASQVIQPLSINTKDSNGNFAGKVLPSPLSPNQYQPGVYENRMPYRIDGLTTVGISILASAVFQIYFYPSFTVNLARTLGEQNLGRSFAAPSIGTPQVAVLKG